MENRIVDENIVKLLAKKLMSIVFGAILLYFFFLKFETVREIISQVLSILSPFILGAGIAFIMKIPMNALENKVFKKSKIAFIRKSARGLSLVLSIIIALAILIFITLMIIPQFIKSLQSLETQLPMFFEFVIEKMREVPSLSGYADQAESFYRSLSFEYIFEQVETFFLSADLTEFNNNFMQAASGIANGLISGVMNILLAFVFSIYILLDKERLGRQTKRILYSVGGEKFGNFIIHVGELINHFFFHFVKGQLLDAVIIGVLTFLAMLILRIPYATMISVLVGFLDLIPIVGPLIGTAVGFIFILIDSPLQAVIFIIVMLVLQQIQGNIIYPKIVGDNLGIPSMWSLFATIVGGSLGGIVGMWVFIPLTAVVYTLLGEYTDFRLKKLGISNLEEKDEE